jgi:hypothetical protein
MSNAWHLFPVTRRQSSPSKRLNERIGQAYELDQKRSILLHFNGGGVSNVRGSTGACQGGCRLSHAANSWVSMLLKCAVTTESRSGLSVTTPM